MSPPSEGSVISGIGVQSWDTSDLPRRCGLLLLLSETEDTPASVPAVQDTLLNAKRKNWQFSWKKFCIAQICIVELRTGSCGSTLRENTRVADLKVH